MIRKLAALMGALAMACGLVLATSTSASAGDYKPYPTCGKGGFCVWDTADGKGNYRHRAVGNQAWPKSTVNDDLYWRNNGYYQPGADHVRIYDAAPSPDKLTLCIHRGHTGNGASNGDTVKAQQRGNYHRWGGECRAAEPQL